MNKFVVKKIISSFKLYSILLLTVFFHIMWFILQIFFLIASSPLFFFLMFSLFSLSFVNSTITPGCLGSPVPETGFKLGEITLY